ncbi:MAG: ABC transporter ATP-binding protein [Myxococcales bacterium]|nr:ABC transporter ATP-binding protein [Myxococcales bacterium]MCB9626933.1 ABC transporter ATP-binding protein [Sandaracinaceae bacterium]
MVAPLAAPHEKTLGSYLRPYWRSLAVGGVFLVLTNVVDKSIPWILQRAIDALVAHELGAVRDYALVVLGLAAVMWVVRIQSRVHVFNVGRDVEFDLRNEIIDKVHQLGPSFFRRMPTGEIMSRATNDLGQLRLLVGFGALNVVNSLLAYVGAIALMVAISPRLTAMALLPYPLFILVARGFGKALYDRSRDAQAALGTLADRAQENLAGVRVVRAFGLEPQQKERFEEANQGAIRANMRLVVTRGFMWPALMLIGSLGTLIVLFQGGRMILADELTVGQFAAFNAYLATLVWPTLAFGYMLSVVQRGRASFERVREILDAEPDIADPVEPVPMRGTGAVRVSGLEVERGGQPVLRDVSLEVPAGSSLAIVGGIGSGKSTLAATLPRLLPAPPATIFVDDQPVEALALRELRQTVAYAQQEPFLFSTSIERNISFGLGNDEPRPDELRRRVRAAAEEACILEEIDNMPAGLDTLVGERGVQLSGGQKQRIALARALLNAPRVLVLDDPLSAVDAKTESRILEALDRAGEGRTLILVTHRVAAAERMDQVVVLEAGRVIERGTHRELIEAGGPYARMAKRQALEAELSTL